MRLNSAAIDIDHYCRVAGYDVPASGGQELLLAEIVGALAGMSSVWLPFHGNGLLARTLEENGHVVITDTRRDTWSLPPAMCRRGIDAVYFGTPTIVADRVLFPESVKHSAIANDWWTAARERLAARTIVESALAFGARRLVSGLGTGDVSLADRMVDMGQPVSVVCYKRFRTFEDWVLVREVSR